MNWDQVEGKWKQFKGVARQKWGKLTDDDLDVVNGKQEELVGKLQERYGYTKEQAEKNIQEWTNSLNEDPVEQEQRRRAS
jgi:uncharacterized protein YjbJ (UPF0337 family)